MTMRPPRDGECIMYAAKQFLRRPPRKSALLLLVLGVLADDHHAALALDDLALFADPPNPMCQPQPLLRQVMRPLVRS